MHWTSEYTSLREAICVLRLVTEEQNWNTGFMLENKISDVMNVVNMDTSSKFGVMREFIQVIKCIRGNSS